jgi:hypothetical protein
MDLIIRQTVLKLVQGFVGSVGWGLMAGKDKPFFEVLEFLAVPFGIHLENLPDEGVQRDCSASSGITLGFSDLQVSFAEMGATPLELTKLLVAKATV